MPNALKFILIPLAILFFARCAVSQAKVDRDNDKLIGVVRTVRVESAQLFERKGRKVEGQRLPQSETSYSVEGWMISRLEFNFDGSARGKTVYTHDGGGKVTEQVYYNPDGSVNMRRSYSYDDAGRVVEELTHVSEGSVSTKVRYTYRPDGSKLSAYVYNEKGDVGVRYDYRADGSTEARHSYKYDAEGKLKKIVNDGTAVAVCGVVYMEESSTAVEFDAYGNWVKSVGGESVTYRIITYH